ncbi:MAG: posphoenolpyruvate synthetase regulatory kinase/phosphorylase PpsR [bacterium]
MTSNLNQKNDGDQQKRTVFFVSDGTAITAETVGRSLLIQFESIDFQSQTFPFIDTPDKARTISERIQEESATSGCTPLVFSTLLLPETRQIIADTGAPIFDLFEMLLGPLQRSIGCDFSQTVGGAHAMSGSDSYFHRVAAIDYTLAHDDGLGSKDLDKADVILVGVSRAGKTPTSLYLSLQFGINAANYPITEEDLDPLTLPGALHTHRDRLFGLTIQPQQLASIREGRSPGTRYASLAQCQYEVSRVEALYRKESIPYLDSTTVSIEELATMIMQKQSLARSGI